MPRTFYSFSRSVVALAALVAGAASAQAAVVADGSLEKGKFVDGGGGYMQLANGSKTIAGWTVTTASGSVVWATTPNEDDIASAKGNHCIDLTGFGATARNGAISQTIHLTAAIKYKLRMDLASFDDASPVVTVGSQTITLKRGKPFSVNGTSWTPVSGTFVGEPNDPSPKLQIQNAADGAELVFIDNVSITPSN